MAPEAPSLEEEHFVVDKHTEKQRNRETLSFGYMVADNFPSPRSWPPTMSVRAALTGLGVNNSIKWRTRSRRRKA